MRPCIRGLARIAAPLLTGLRHDRAVVVVCDGAGALLRKVTLEGVGDRSLLPVRDVLAWS